jgi:hypothetical protein
VGPCARSLRGGMARANSPSGGVASANRHEGRRPKCHRRIVLETFDLQAICPEGYAFQIETVYQAHRKGFRIAEVPIVFADPKVGTSKMSRAVVAEAFTYVSPASSGTSTGYAWCSY